MGFIEGIAVAVSCLLLNRFTMLKIIIAFAALTFIAINSYAQHCPWDGTSMITIDVKKTGDEKVQKIYLADSSEHYVMSKHYMADKVEADTARFWKNPSANVKSNSFGPGQRFAFAKDYEILALGGHDQPRPYKVRIIYTEGNQTFEKEVPLLNNNIHLLCTLNKELWSGKVKPMSVI